MISVLVVRPRGREAAPCGVTASITRADDAAEGEAPQQRAQSSDVPAGEEQHRRPRDLAGTQAELMGVEGDEQDERQQRQRHEGERRERARAQLGRDDERGTDGAQGAAAERVNGLIAHTTRQTASSTSSIDSPAASELGRTSSPEPRTSAGHASQASASTSATATTAVAAEPSKGSRARQGGRGWDGGTTPSRPSR